jgi:hypothetical protein
MENLSNEILLKILNFLDFKSLLNILETSIRFRDLVENSQVLMSKLSVEIDFRNIFWNCFGDEICVDKSIDALTSSTRKYQKICLNNLKENGFVTKLWEQVDEFLRKFSENLKCLKFFNCEFSSIDLLEMLCLLPKLQSLSFHKVIVIFDIESNFSTFNKVYKLKNLKQLEIKNSEMTEHFFKILVHVENLENLSIDDFVENLESEECFLKNEFRSLERFLCQQKSLKSLEINGDCSHSQTFLKGTESATNFELSILKLKGFENCSLENIAKFLKTQKKLKSLEIDVSCRKHEFYDEIFQHTFNLENLQELQLNIIVSNKLKYNLKRYQRFQSASNLRTLSLYYIERDDVDPQEWMEYLLLENFSFAFPHLKKFRLFYYGNLDDRGALKVADLQAINNWKHLDSLEIQQINGNFLKQFALKNLKNLKSCLRDVAIYDWETFTRNNRGIQNLTIEINSIDNESIDLITRNLKNLENISISSFCYNLKDINENTIEIILKNCTFLKSLNLELPSSCEKMKQETQDLLDSKIELKCEFSFYREQSLKYS